MADSKRILGPALLVTVPLLAALLLAALLLGFPAAAPAAPPAAAVLFVRMAQADSQFAYKGRQMTTYWKTGRTVAVEVSNHPPGLHRIAYLDPERLRGRVLLTDGSQQWQYDPRLRTLRLRRLPAGVQDAADETLSYTLLRTNYLLMIDPHPRLWAERKVWLVSILRPAGRSPARKFWVDAASGLILKREIYWEDSRPMVTVAYTDITFRPGPSRAKQEMEAARKAPGVHFSRLSAPAETVIPLAQAGRQLAGQAYAPLGLSGYRLVGATAALLGGKPVLHLRYSDGLNLVSLFEQRRTQPRRPTRVPTAMRPTRIGPIAAHESHRAALTTFNWDTPTLNLTLMGEVGADALRALAAKTVAGK